MTAGAESLERDDPTRGARGGAAAQGEKTSAASLPKARWTTMILGLVGVAILCPIVQWLELGGREDSSFAQSGVPPVAVVTLIGLVLAAALASLFKKVSPRADFVLLYGMFSMATLVCSAGLVRSIYGHMSCVMDELIVRKVSTFGIGYELQKAEIFPKISTPVIPDDAIKTEGDRLARERAYADLVEFSNQLRRDPRDVPPANNHADPRYDLRDKSELAADGVRLQWWWRERFKRDALGGIKKDVQAWRDVQRGAGVTPTEGLPGYPQEVIERLKAHPPSAMQQWLADHFLSDVSATHARTVVSPSGEPQTLVGTRTIPWRIWAWPLFHWSLFALLVIGLLTCLAEVFRRVWLKIQNLPMPLVEVPDGIMSLLPDGRKRGRLLLLAGALFGFMWVSLRAGAKMRVPGFELFAGNWGGYDLSPAFSSTPWKYMGQVQLSWSPVLICIALLVSLEVSRSIWSMTWICNLALVVLGAIGISAATVPTPQQVKGFYYQNFPYWDDQVAGAMIIFTLWMLWASRGPLIEVLSGLWKKPDAAKVGDALISPRILPWLLVGLLIVIPCHAWYMGATSLKFLAMLLGLFLVFTIAAARLRAETGYIMVPAMVTMSRYTMMFGGPKTFGAEAATVGNSFYFLSSSLISVILPQQLEVAALAERQHVSLRRLALGMMLASIVAIAVSMPFLLLWQYGNQGGVNPATWTSMAGGKDSFYLLYRFGGRELDQGRFEAVRIVATAVGGAIMLTLLVCRARFSGFPMHPIGYIAAGAFVTGQYYASNTTFNVIWGPMLIAWLIKSSVFKIGGAELFSRFLPAIRGVIIGHLGAIVVWALIRKVLLDTNDPLYFTW